MKELYKFFKFNGRVIDIEDYDESVLNIFSRQVLIKLIVTKMDGKKCYPKEYLS